MLFLDGVYVPAQGGVYSRRLKRPNTAELELLIYRFSERIGRYLERQDLLARDKETSYLTLESRDDSTMDALRSDIP